MKNKKTASIYVHIPFCIKKCGYCDFLSFPATETMRASYLDALCHEIAGYASDDREIVSLYFGGGTPSLLTGAQAETLIACVGDNFPLRTDAEITIEANPGTLTGRKCADYLRAGVNRLSIGLQSTIDRELRILGRIHTYDEFLEQYHTARDKGFSNISIDLMSALPDQAVSDYLTSVERVARLRPEHISAYSLTVEEGTPFGKDPELPGRLPDEDAEREMYYAAGDLLRGFGYERYEISNYAKPGYESLHNTGYWTGREYLGFGLGASSYYRGARYHNCRDLDRYLSLWGDPAGQRAPWTPGDVSAGKNTAPFVEDYHSVTERERMEEFMFLGLRRTEGVSRETFQETFHRAVDDVYGDAIRKLERKKLIETDGKRIKLTDKGIDVSNYALSEFLF